MSSSQPTWQRILAWIVPLLVVLALLLGAVRLLLTPQFIHFEYNTPNFPEDRYGFTLEDRLKWAPLALEYLMADVDISFLGELRFEDGSPLYNQRELRHMVDVKNLTLLFLNIWYGSLIVLLGLGLWSWRGGWWKEYRGMLGGGGMLTVVLIAVLLLFVALSFRQIFVGFHRIFFEGDTWLFLFSDTLIRLFPLRFWRDVFIALGALSIIEGALVWLLFGRRAARSPETEIEG